MAVRCADNCPVLQQQMIGFLQILPNLRFIDIDLR